MQKLSLSYMILIVVLGSVTITTVLADSYNITNYPYVINDTSNDKPFVITSLGNVGINNASPSSSLDVGGAVTVGPTVAIGSTQLSEMNFRQINKAAPTYAMDATARINYYADSAGGYVRSLDIVSSSVNTPSQIKFFTSSDGATIAEKMLIDPSGHVGIGNTSPSSQLDVGGALTIGPTGAIGSLQSSEITFRQINQAAPTYAMDATARLNYYADSAGGYVRSLDIVSSSYNTPSQIKFFTSSDGATIAEKMRIDSSGNVGIGTTAPAQKLDVAGNIRLTGNIVSPNDICIGSC